MREIILLLCVIVSVVMASCMMFLNNEFGILISTCIAWALGIIVGVKH
jgi:hypothetical protein